MAIHESREESDDSPCPDDIAESTDEFQILVDLNST